MAGVRANPVRAGGSTAPRLALKHTSNVKPTLGKINSPVLNTNRVVNHPLKTQTKPNQPTAKKELALGTLRQKAVKNAWAQEKPLVQAGEGTRKWTTLQRRELVRTGKVKGFEGHHIKSVNGHTKKWAGDPRNIKFVTRKEHIREHKGNFRNETKGNLIDRQKLLNATKNQASARKVKK